MTRVVTALLADYALAHPDGKLYITGGGIHVLPVPTIPYTHPTLALAGSVAFDPDECDRPHRIGVISKGPGGDAFIKPTDVWLVPLRGPDDTTPTVVPFVFTVREVLLTRYGQYALALELEDGSSHPLPAIYVVRDTRGTSAWRIADGEGREAYAHGDLQGAKDAFERLVEEYPGNPDGHNNLGFVLLELGAADEALRHFQKAREHGYVQMEITDANIACCYYLLGDHRSAFDLFRTCYKERSLTTSCWLFEIADDHLVRRSLQSSSDYVRLMALNAGWSAAGAGLQGEARKWLRIAYDAEAEREAHLYDSSTAILRRRIDSTRRRSDPASD